MGEIFKQFLIAYVDATFTVVRVLLKKYNSSWQKDGQIYLILVENNLWMLIKLYYSFGSTQIT